MRKNPMLLLVICLVVLLPNSNAQQYWFPDKQELTASGVTVPTQLSRVQQINLNVLCRVWGVIKYFHPQVANGRMNADKALFAILPDALRTNSKTFQKLLIRWIDELGYVPLSGWDAIPENVLWRTSMSWMEKKPVLSELGEKLKYIVRNRYTDTGYYVHPTYPLNNPDFSNEFRYKNAKGEDGGMRMLALFRYWNTVEYFFPSKYLTADNWDTVLLHFIPKFAMAATDKDYRMACVELAATVHDTHANNVVSDSVVTDVFGAYTIPVMLANVQDSMVVFYNVYDSLKNSYPLQPGDRLIAVNGEDTRKKLETIRPYITASNRSSFMNIAINRLRRTPQPDNVFTVIRGMDTLQQHVRSLPLRGLSTAGMRNHVSSIYPMYRKIGEDIGYINIGKIKIDSLPIIFEAFEHTKGLVIDLRNYPSEFVTYALAQYIKPMASPFVRFSDVDYEFPGRFLIRKSNYSGSDSAVYYQGKIVILVYEATQSQAEFTTMSLRTAPNAVVMGSQTSGADGNVSNVFFPGGMSSYISGYGVYYPDLTPTQGVGIVPDIVVRPTIAGIRRGEDELLESAIKYIRSDAPKKK